MNKFRPRSDVIEQMANDTKMGDAIILKRTLSLMRVDYCQGCGHTHLMPVLDTRRQLPRMEREV